MKNVLVLLILICSVHFAYTQLSVSERTSAQKELEQLQSMNFDKNEVYSFLMAPEVMAPELFYQPHWWSFIKEKYNYQEESIPQGIQLLSGDADQLDFEHPNNWNAEDFFPVEYFSLSPSGKLIEHVYQDSTVYFYDNQDRLRQTVSYSGGYLSILYLQRYNYDSHGNLVSSAYFFYEDDEYYLDHYDTFSYALCDSGFYLRHDHHLVIDLEEKELETTTQYSFFNAENDKKRSYTLSANRNTFTRFEYQKIQNTNYLTSVVEYELESSEPISEELKYRDSKGRVNYTRSSTFGGYAPYSESDSIVYISDYEKQQFNYSRSGLYRNALTVTKYDSYHNLIRREIYDLTADDPDKIQILSTYNYDLMKNGTWKAQALKYVYWDDKTSRECYIRQFLDHPIGKHHPKFQESDILRKQIERIIPPEKR